MTQYLPRPIFLPLYPSLSLSLSRISNPLPNRTKHNRHGFAETKTTIDHRKTKLV